MGSTAQKKKEIRNRQEIEEKPKDYPYGVNCLGSNFE